MTQYELYKAINIVMRDIIPPIIRESIDVQMKVDALPDFPTYKEVGEAIGITAAQVARYVRDMEKETVYFKSGRTRRIHKADFVDMILHHRYQNNNNHQYITS